MGCGRSFCLFTTPNSRNQRHAVQLITAVASARPTALAAWPSSERRRAARRPPRALQSSRVTSPPPAAGDWFRWQGRIWALVLVEFALTQGHCFLTRALVYSNCARFTGGRNKIVKHIGFDIIPAPAPDYLTATVRRSHRRRRAVDDYSHAGMGSHSCCYC